MLGNIVQHMRRCHTRTWPRRSRRCGHRAQRRRLSDWRSSCRCSRRRAPPRSGWWRGGTRWTRRTDVDDIGGSVWIQPVDVTDGESIRSPARLSSFRATKSRVWVAVWRLGLALGTVDLAMERVSASSRGSTVPEVVGRRAEAVSRLGRPAGRDRGVQEGRRGAAARQSAGLLSAARGPRPAPTNPTLNPAACHHRTRT